MMQAYNTCKQATYWLEQDCARKLLNDLAQNVVERIEIDIAYHQTVAT